MLDVLNWDCLISSFQLAPFHQSYSIGQASQEMKNGAKHAGHTVFWAVCIHYHVPTICLISVPRPLVLGDVNCLYFLCSLSLFTDVLTVVFHWSSGTVSLQFLDDYQSCLWDYICNFLQQAWGVTHLSQKTWNHLNWLDTLFHFTDLGLQFSLYYVCSAICNLRTSLPTSEDWSKRATSYLCPVLFNGFSIPFTYLVLGALPPAHHLCLSLCVSKQTS